MSFMAVDHSRLKQSMGQGLVDILEAAEFELQPSEMHIVQRAPDIFSVISGVHRTADETLRLLDGSCVIPPRRVLHRVMHACYSP